MKNITLFQGIVIAISIVSAIVGLLLFSTFKGGAPEEKSDVTIWGFYPEVEFRGLVDELEITPEVNFLSLRYINYFEKEPETFDSELVEALAVGKGPDVVLVDHDTIFRNWNKFVPVTYEAFSARTFQDTYIQGADVNRTTTGIRAFPVISDPLVMYWNRDVFTSLGIAQPPKTWTEFLSIVPEISKSDDLGTVFQSAVAMGEYKNITHAKDIISTLMMQAGNPIVRQTQEVFDDGTSLTTFNSALLEKKQNEISRPAENALQFYTQYSDPSRDLYSWNKSLGNDKDLFLQEDLIMYFGKASEYEKLKRRNPNLNFDVAPLPQRSVGNKLVASDFMSLAVVKNHNAARDNYQGVLDLLNPYVHGKLAERINLPSTRRDLVAQEYADAVYQAFNQVTLYSTAFVDVAPRESDVLFEEMIQNYTTGAKGLSETLSDVSAKLNVVLIEAAAKRK